jgi:hypothetical protein
MKTQRIVVPKIDISPPSRRTTARFTWVTSPSSCLSIGCVVNVVVAATRGDMRDMRDMIATNYWLFEARGLVVLT